MRKRRTNILPVRKISLDAFEMAVTVLFIRTNSASFSLYEMSEGGKSQDPIMQVDGSKPLHCKLLSSAYVGSDTRLAYLVHDLSVEDDEPMSRVVISLLGHNGPLENGCIIIDIPPQRVVTGYLELDEEAEP